MARRRTSQRKMMWWVKLPKRPIDRMEECSSVKYYDMVSMMKKCCLVTSVHLLDLSSQ
jgi:hypothetical protein